MSDKKKNFALFGAIGAMALIPVIIIVGIIVLGVIAAMVIRQMDVQRAMKNHKVHYEMVNNFKQELSSSCMLYVSQQRRYPTRFSDFVAVSKHITPGKLLYMDKINMYIAEPKTQNALDSNTLLIVFNTGNKVAFTLGNTCQVGMIGH